MNLLKLLSPFFMVELCTLYGGKGGGAPPPPDYTGAAREQAAASQELATQNTWANRPTQNTPWGSTSWSTGQAIDPATGQPVTTWTQNQTLDPALQGALNDQLAIQQGKSSLAQGFMGRVADEYSQPFNWGAVPGAAGTPQTQQTYARGLQTYLPQAQLDLQRQGQTTSAQGGYGMTPTGQQTGVQGYQYDLSAPQQTTQTTNQANFVNERQRIENQLFERMRPEQQRQEDQVRTMLANQGLTPGSEAYNQELQRLGDQQARERFNALEMGGAEQQRLQNMLMGQQAQAFGQDVQSQQAQNAALQAQFGQGLQQGQFTNQALQNLFAQQQGAGAMGLQREQQAFGQAMQGQQAYNQALAQQQALAAQQGQFYNQAQQQMFGQNQAANQQNFQQMMAQAEYQNRLRQQAIAEQQMQRGMSLNEMNALLTGAQVQNPQMPSFNNATMGQAPQLLQAAGMQGNYNMQAAQMDQQADQALWGGIGQLAGTAGMMFL